MKYKAIIFDLDGTLLESLKGIGDAMNRLLERLGYSLHSTDDYRYMVGDGIDMLVRRALPEHWQEGSGKGESIKELVAEYRRIYDQLWPLETIPYDGIVEMLNRLQEMQVGMAILSNKSEDFTRRMVTELLPDWHFAHVRGAQPGIPIKPDPSVALEIAGAMNLSPADILFVGDTKVDMETGVNAGMVPVGVTWGFREPEELTAHGALHLIDHPMSLTEIVKGHELKN